MSNNSQSSNNNKKTPAADLLAGLDSSYLDIIAQAVQSKPSGNNTALYEARKAHEVMNLNELHTVLSYYDIGTIKRTKTFSRGSRNSPKVLIRSSSGLYLLKRRAAQLSDISKVQFSHQLQQYIHEQGFPLPCLIDTKENQSFVQLENGNKIYEIFEYIKGTFFDKSNQATYQCGSALGTFHTLCKDYQNIYKLPHGSYHNSKTIKQVIEDIPEAIIKARGYAGIDTKTRHKLRKLVKSLQFRYSNCAKLVDGFKFDEFPQQIIHGDWHPGNMRFKGDNLKSVLDYDSVRYGRPITDIANGLLQFSVVGGNPQLAKWPSYLDEERLFAFMQGYHSAINYKIRRKHLKAIPFLMSEALIAESAIPIAATGKFSHVDGLDFLVMVKRKVDWINDNAKRLSKLLRR